MKMKRGEWRRKEKGWKGEVMVEVHGEDKKVETKKDFWTDVTSSIALKAEKNFNK